ncbi:MAG: hypothetical protein Q7U28_16865 [Aquabacterium sp.]|nr:hypothetical protein [Aquabacterium sp.]
MRVQSGSGVAASVLDEAYAAAGGEITDAAETFGATMALMSCLQRALSPAKRASGVAAPEISG